MSRSWSGVRPLGLIASGTRCEGKGTSGKIQDRGSEGKPAPPRTSNLGSGVIESAECGMGNAEWNIECHDLSSPITHHPSRLTDHRSPITNHESRFFLFPCFSVALTCAAVSHRVFSSTTVSALP